MKGPTFTRDIIGFLSKETDFANTSLVEKDLLINILLGRLAEGEDFRNRYVFKGGTCLIKSFFGYYRFSEDIDLTYGDPSLLENLSRKKMRRRIMSEVDDIANSLLSIAEDEDLDFQLEKSNER